MNSNISKQVRKTLIALLNDDDGINSIGYAKLRALAIDICPGENSDLFDKVRGCEGRYYLPKDHGLTAK